MEERKWENFHAAAAEGEMSDLLFSLVRMLKPALVVESGSFHGDTTEHLRFACQSNYYGRVISCEVNEEYLAQARNRCIEERLTFFHGRAVDLPELKECDFFFCDSNYECRREEMELVKPGCFVVVHDTTHASWESYGRGSGTSPVYEYVKAQKGLLFEVSRGFGMFVKQ